MTNPDEKQIGQDDQNIAGSDINENSNNNSDIEDVK